VPAAPFKLRSPSSRDDFEPPSIDGSGARLELAVEGRRVVGQVELAKPNPKGRLRCKVEYTAPKSWSDDHHAAALCVAAHWFRDIGGLNCVRKAELCHVVRRLEEGVTEREMHAAITAYADSEWHRGNRQWTTIRRFFLQDFLAKWIDESPALRRERDQANRVQADAEYAARMRADQERARRDLRDRAKARREKHAADRPSPKRPADSAREANDRLPKGDRWVLPTLLSKRADRDAKARAADRSLEVIVRIWPLLPARVRGQVDTRVQLVIRRRTGDLVPLASLPKRNRAQLRLAQLLRVMQSEYRSTVADIAPSISQLAHGGRGRR
jgi:hypothetical protein